MLPLGEVKDELRIEHDEDDALVARLIAAAQAHLEKRTSLYLGEPRGRTEYRYGTGRRVMWLDGTPVQEESGPAVTVEDVDTADFRVVGRRLERLDRQVWSAWTEYAVSYTDGYSSGAAPANLRQAAMMLVSHWYENPSAAIVGTVSAEVAQGVETLLEPFRRMPV